MAHFDLHSKVSAISSESWSQEGAVVQESSSLQRKKKCKQAKARNGNVLHAVYALVPKSATLFQENKFLHTEEEAMPEQDGHQLH